MNSTKNKVKAVVLGATGLVGQHFVRMLAGHPYFETVGLASSPRSAGAKYGSAVPWMVGGCVPFSAAGLDLLDCSADALGSLGARVAFSALPRSAAEGLEPELRRRGLFIFSNASSHRLDPDVPIVVPEINADHLELARSQASSWGGAIVTNSNCSTAGLVLVLKALERFGLTAVTVTTFQAISGGGRRGVAAMDIAANVIPFIRDEEAKMSCESRKILGHLDAGEVRAAEFQVNASCCRVPVRDGHLLSLRLDFSQPIDPADARQALTHFRGLAQDLRLPTAPEHPVLVRAEEDRPQPVLDAMAGTPERARGMAVTVGRLRGRGRSLNCFALVHNTIRGAAGTCLLNAELAFRQSFFG